MVIEHRSSFSQHNTFEQCARWWYYSKVAKIPYISDMCHADAGNVIHKTLEQYHQGKIKTVDEAKEVFNKQWFSKRLELSKISENKDDYWLMVINGMDKKINATSTELKIYYPEVLGFLDVVDTENDEIFDWKSSKRSTYNEVDYKKQMIFYSYLYTLKFDRLPKKCTVFYLRYNGTKGELVVIPTTKDVLEIETWYYDILKKMNDLKETQLLPERCEECAMFCPYGDECSKKLDEVNFKIHIKGNNAQLEGKISPLLYKGIYKKMSYELKNAFFIKRAKPNARTTVEFFNMRNRSFPMAFISGLRKTIEDYTAFMKAQGKVEIIDYRKFDDTNVETPDKFLNGVILRDYQNNAVDEFIKNKVGILEVGTGGGKTEIAIECIRRLGMPTLFIVDKIELLRQTKKRIEESLGIKVGQLGGGIKDDIQDVMLATVQTLTKNMAQYASYLRLVRFVIFDECHKVAAQSYIRISRQLLSSEYRLGMSGTAFRDDGNDKMITAATGSKIFDLSSKVLINNGWLIMPKIIFYEKYLKDEEEKKLLDDCKDDLINETEKYSDYYDGCITHNKSRNILIRNIVNDNKNKKTLILVKLIEHGNLLEEMINDSKYLHGSINKEERKKMFDAFKDGKLKVLISTISIFAEGIDIPDLDTVINAAANKGEVKTIQVLGRVLRKIVGKKDAKYIDFIDYSRFFRGSSLGRKKILQKEGHNVSIIKFGGESETKIITKTEN